MEACLVLQVAERLHRRFVVLVKQALLERGIHDLSVNQALILSRIGSSQLRVTEILEREYYLGVNLTYNLRDMLEGGYIVTERHAVDRRVKLVSLTPAGLEIAALVAEVYAASGRAMAASTVNGECLADVAGILERAAASLIRVT